MDGLLLRVIVIGVLLGAVWLAVAAGRATVARRMRAVLAASPVAMPTLGAPEGGETEGARVRILAFGSEDCAQCKRLQEPALARVVAARAGAVAVVPVDAPSAPELTEHYRVLTLPATVVLDAAGRARAVNYGFADTPRLLEQVDAVLADPAPLGAGC
jgi:thiol-disulfide isomerase/thioredoxin